MLLGLGRTCKQSLLSPCATFHSPLCALVLHTLTFDNGREFAYHEKISEALGISIFFAKPYHSWERGANENANGLYRQYIPKGTDFQFLDKGVLPTARLMLNARPRKRLNFISPIQEIYRIFASDFKLINIVNKVAFVT